MVHWICDVRLERRIRTQELHEKLDIISLTEEIRWRSLRHFGHLRRMDENVWPRRVNCYVVPGILPRGRPQLRWSDVITKDLKDLNIRKELVNKRVGWGRVIMPRKIQLQRVQPIRGVVTSKVRVTSEKIKIVIIIMIFIISSRKKSFQNIISSWF